MKKRKNIWWTVQLIPHSKGNIHSYKVKILPVVSVISLIFFVLVTGVLTSIFFWNTIKQMDHQITQQHSRMDAYIVENTELRDQLSALNRELSDLYFEVMELQEYMREVEELEQQIKQLEGLDTSMESTNTSPDDADKHPLVAVAGFSMTVEQRDYALLGSGPHPTVAISTDELRSKIFALREQAESQQVQLAELKDQIEEEQYRALFIPSIPPTNGRLSSPYGWRRDPFHGGRTFHTGIDFVSYFRAPIYATAHGTVQFADRNGGYGNQVVIDHGNGYQTSYSHLSMMTVSQGDQVERGEIIGRMGSTGRSTGVHLHYEVLLHGAQVNPAPYLTGGRRNVE
jgi:septal ring factor EnvC (AmiA/AmiB activator)